MKSTMFKLNALGEISVESIQALPAGDTQSVLAGWLARLNARRDPEGIELAHMSRDHIELSNQAHDINTLSGIATSLEALTETVNDLLVANGLTPQHVKRFETLANEVAAPMGEPEIVLTDADGVVSTESITKVAMTAYASVISGVKRLVNTVNQYYMRYRGLSGQLQRQLRTLQSDLKRIRYEEVLEFEPTAAMAGICNAEGEFVLSEAADALDRFTGDVKWVVNILAPETANLLGGVSNWIDQLDVMDDNALNASFSKVLDLNAPLPPTGWTTIANTGYSRLVTVIQSQPAFTDYCFTAVRPSKPQAVDADYLVNDLSASEFNYGPRTNSTIIANDGVIAIDSIDTVLKMIDRSLEVLDFHDVFQLHSARLVKELNGLMNAGQRLMQRAGAATSLSEASLAKLVLAIQAPQQLSLKAQSPFRDVLYESIRVITGVVSLANSVKSAVKAAE